MGHSPRIYTHMYKDYFKLFQKYSSNYREFKSIKNIICLIVVHFFC